LSSKDATPTTAPGTRIPRRERQPREQGGKIRPKSNRRRTSGHVPPRDFIWIEKAGEDGTRSKRKSEKVRVGRLATDDHSVAGDKGWQVRTKSSGTIGPSSAPYRDRLNPLWEGATTAAEHIKDSHLENHRFRPPLGREAGRQRSQGLILSRINSSMTVS